MFQLSFYRIIITFLLLSLFGCENSSSSAKNYQTLAFYGDITKNRIVIIDVENMELIKSVDLVGKLPYTIERAGDRDEVYAITRNSNFVEVFDMFTFEKIQDIKLEHYPRSSAYNAKLGLLLISGFDQARSSLIDVAKHKVVAVVGDSSFAQPEDYGGSSATGHPFWVSADKFVLLDRAGRKVILYEVKKEGEQWRVELLNEVSTPTSVHHFIGKGLDDMYGGIKDNNKTTPTTFYAVSEGNQEEQISPALLRLKLDADTLSLEKELFLSDENMQNMGTHHGTFHPIDTNIIYMGSTEGKLYVIDYINMKVKKVIQVGLGAAHVKFIPEKNLAIVTNHKDTFITLINTRTDAKIKDVTVSTEGKNGKILQSHTGFVSLETNSYYSFATDDGIFYELDLDTHKIKRTLNTGGTPMQGSFIKY